jgi:hypothetical protein
MYQIFTTIEAAQAYCGAGTAKLPKHTGDRTTIWDIPRELADGRFVVISHDGTGTEWQAEWVLPEIGDGLLAGVH